MDKKKIKKTKKKNPGKFDEKYKDTIVDIFANNQKNNDFIFNKAPIVLDKKKKKFKKTLLTKRKQKSVFIDSEEEEFDLFESKKTKKFEEKPDFSFGNLLSDFKSFFLSNKGSIKSLQKIPKFIYSEGTLICAAICDKGPNSKYLVASLPRNKKAYISLSEISEQITYFDLKNFFIGELIIGTVLNSASKHIQLSLKPSRINSFLTYEDLLQNQIVTGIAMSKEKEFVRINLYAQEPITVFANISEIEIEIVIGKPYILQIKEKDVEEKIIYADFISFKNNENNNNNNLLKITKEDDLEIDYQHIAKPGNFVKVIVVKILENGLLVRFLSFFYGFIFEDHLEKEIKNYKPGDKFTARILALDTQNKQIHLNSIEKFNCFLTTDKNNFKIGKIFDGFTLEKKMFGESFLVKISSEKNSFLSFLHKTHLNEDSKNALENGNIGEYFKIQIKPKEINYLENFAISTTKTEFLENQILGWNEIEVGDILDGKILKIIKSDKKSKIIVSFFDKINGIIDYLNISDHSASSVSLKKFKARVLSIDPETKKLFLTIKPIFLETKNPILTNYEEAITGSSFYGNIVALAKNSYIVKFFNEVRGLLSFRDIEDFHNTDRNLFHIGQTVKVYIVNCNINQQKLSLSLSMIGVEKGNKFIEKNKSIDKEILENLGNDIDQLEISVGDVFNYKVLRKKSLSSNDYLILKKVGAPSHKAFVLKNHISDFKEIIESLFQIYKKSKDIIMKAKIIEISENGNIFITLKKTLINQIFPELKQYHSYWGYVDKVTNSKILIKINENIKGIAYKENVEPEKSYYEGGTINFFIQKFNKDSNFICSLLSEKCYSKFSCLLAYLQEEFEINKRIAGKNLKKWNNIKIGNFIKGNVSLIKDYGVIVNVFSENFPEKQITGFIKVDILRKNKENYIENEEIFCKILDIDYEKELVDLEDVEINQEKYDKLKLKTNYNIDKIRKYNIIGKKGNLNNVFTCKIVLVKDYYCIARLEKYPKVLVLIDAINFNSKIPSHEIYQSGNKKKNFKLINIQELKDSLEKIKEKHEEITYLLNKSYYTIVLKEMFQKTNMDIEENNNFGRVHKTEFDYISEKKTTVFDNFSMGDSLETKILEINHSKKKDNPNMIELELTCKKSHLELDDGLLDQNELLPQNLTEIINKKCLGVIKSVSQTSINPLYIELGNNLKGYCSAFESIFSPDEAEKLNEIEKYFKIGEIYIFEINGLKEKSEKSKVFNTFDLKLSNNINVSFETGQLCICRVSQIFDLNVKSQISNDKFGLIDITEISDDWLLKPQNTLQLFRYYPARIISNKNDKIYLSVRETFLKEKTWKTLSFSGSTIDYKKNFSLNEKNGDLRCRLYKLGSNSLKKNMLVVGYIINITDSGIFVKLGFDLVVRASNSELSDNFLKKDSFFKGQVVLGRILDIKEDNKVNISLRKSVVKYGYALTKENLKIGITVEGVVSGHKNNKAIVNLKGSYLK